MVAFHLSGSLTDGELWLFWTQHPLLECRMDVERPPLAPLLLAQPALGHTLGRCGSRSVRPGPLGFPGSRRALSCGFGRHVVRRRRGCLKDGLAEAAATAAGGGVLGGSGSVELTLLSVRPGPRPGGYSSVLRALPCRLGSVRRQRQSV